MTRSNAAVQLSEPSAEPITVSYQGFTVTRSTPTIGAELAASTCASRSMTPP